MQGHNNHDNNEALQTGRTLSANTVKPCLKLTINLYCSGAAKKMCSGNVPSSLNNDLGGISYVDFDTKLRHKSQLCFQDDWDILILFPPIILFSKLIGPNTFSTRLWYVFEGTQNHHFLMVLQLAFQSNSFSLTLIQTENVSLDFNTQGASASK